MARIVNSWQARRRALRQHVTDVVDSVEAPKYSTDELRAELIRFERELRAAGLKENSVITYVDRTSRFLKWLDGDYRPRGPN